MRLLFLAALLSSAFAAVVLAAKDQPGGATTTPTTQSTSHGKPVNRFCPVEGEPNEVDPKAIVFHDGKVIGFCCKDCIHDFNADPAKYADKIK